MLLFEFIRVVNVLTHALSATLLAPGTLGCAARHDSYSCQWEGFMLRYLRRRREVAAYKEGEAGNAHHWIVVMSPASNDVDAFHPI